MKRTLFSTGSRGDRSVARIDRVAARKPTSDEASGSAKAAAEHKLAELTIDEVDAKIAKNDGKTFVYDDNDHDVYASGHVPSAKHLDPDKVSASALPADKDATLIFYCANTH